MAIVPNDLSYMRLGLSVSKRVGNAVTRNLVKRRIRSVFSCMDISDGWDVVVTAKPRSSQASFAELDTAIQKSVERAGAGIVSTNPKVVA